MDGGVELCPLRFDSFTSVFLFRFGMVMSISTGRCGCV